MKDEGFGWDGGRTAVEFPEEGVTLSLRVTRIGERRYRLDDVPFGIESAGFRDQVEAEHLDSGGLRVVRAVERSGWRTLEYAPPRGALHADHLERVIARVEEIGGHWEPFQDDRLILCIPPGQELDLPDCSGEGELGTAGGRRISD